MITDLLAARARETPGKTLIVTADGTTHSYADIYTASLRFASRLQSLGIREKDHVALIGSNSAAFLICWFGCNLAGAVAVTLNDGLVGDGLQYCLEQSDSKLIIADASWLEARKGDIEGICASVPPVVIGPDAEFIKETAKWPEATPAVLASPSPATILYTSGSTGRPKGVLNSHAAYEAVGKQTVKTVGMTEDDRILVFLPLFHANPQMFAVMAVLTVGASMAVLRKFSAGPFFEDAVRLGATCFTFVGTVLSILAARHREPRLDHGIRWGVGGGTPRDVWEAIGTRFGIKAYEGYGMTETGCFATCNSVDAYRIGSCGKARSDMDVCILDENDQQLGPGKQGEIAVRPKSPFVIMSGYYKRPDLTLEALGNLWFHTGDRGTLDKDGFLYFHGRLKELIRRGGEMISPMEIETKLREMPKVVDCAIVGVHDPIQGEEIKAVVVAKEPFEARLIPEFLQDKLPRYMLPRYVEFTAAIPKTETEKILRYKLQDLGPTVIDLKRSSES